MRIRFSTSNPQDMSDEVIDVIAKYPNICRHIHLPVQSGSNKILKKMNRLHTREEYLVLIKKIKTKIPNCSISHDIIAGFPSEDDKDHLDTLNLMESVKYEYGYMFKYSERPGTMAQKKFTDNVPLEIKNLRLKEIITKQNKHSDPDASNTGGVSKALQYLFGTFDVQYMKYFALLVAKSQ